MVSGRNPSRSDAARRTRRLALMVGCVAAMFWSGAAAERSNATPTACHDLFRVDQIVPLRRFPGLNTVVVGHINADRRDDVAIGGSDGIRVLLANAHGDLDIARSPPAGPSIMSLLAGDLTSDGRMDLVGSNGGPVMVLPGDGHGHFTLATQTPAQNSFVQALADLNADARADVVMTTVEPGGAYLHLLLSDGTGTLRDAAAFPVAANGFDPAAVTDFDADGRPDVLLGGRAGARVLQMLSGDGSGDLRPAVAPDNGIASVGAMALADFNQDGRVDVAVMGFGVASVLFGAGRGHFIEPHRKILLGGGGFSGRQGLAAADFNGDGLTDLALAGNDNGDVFVYLNRSKGRFRLAAGTPEYGGIYPSAPLVVGDIDGDRRPDLIGLRGGGAPALRVLRNTGGRTPPHARRQTITMAKPRPDEVSRGDAVVLSARLRCHPGSVALFRRPLRRPRMSWRRLQTVSTDYRGVAEVSDRPGVSSEYQWRPTGRGKGRIKPTRRVTVRVIRRGSTTK